MNTVRIYDGSLVCNSCDKCPVVDLVPEEGRVIIHDPHKPENGQVTMTVAEYNALLANARPIP